MKTCAFAPATVANLACGFDVLGLALDAPGDHVVAERSDRAGVVLARIEGDSGRLPREAHLNTASVAVSHLLERALGPRPPVGVRLSLTKGLPLASGMGSSAASAVAAVVAVQQLLSLEDIGSETLLACALEGERMVSGSAHADNVAACLYGGLVLVRAIEPLDVVPLPVPSGLTVAILRPHLELSTRDSRRLIGSEVPLASAVTQWANVGALVSGLHTQDWDLISRSLVDVIAEPVRKKQVPAFEAIQHAALEAGALGCSLSGSGPSMFALCRDRPTATEAARRMEKALSTSTDLGCETYVSPVSPSGAHLVEDSP